MVLRKIETHSLNGQDRDQQTTGEEFEENDLQHLEEIWGMLLRIPGISARDSEYGLTLVCLDYAEYTAPKRRAFYSPLPGEVPPEKPSMNGEKRTVIDVKVKISRSNFFKYDEEILANLKNAMKSKGYTLTGMGTGSIVFSRDE